MTPYVTSRLIEAAQGFLDRWHDGQRLNGAALNSALVALPKEAVVVSRELLTEVVNCLDQEDAPNLVQTYYERELAEKLRQEMRSGK